MVPEKKPEEPEEPKGPAGMGYLTVILVVLLLVSAPIFVAYTFLTDEEQDDGGDGGEEEEEEDWYEKYDYSDRIPTHSQLLIREDTVMSNIEIELQNNLTIINASTLRLVNCTIIVHDWKTDLEKYLEDLKGPKSTFLIHVDKDCTLILEGCTVIDEGGSFGGFRVVLGRLEAYDTHFLGQQLRFRCSYGNLRFESCDLELSYWGDILYAHWSEVSIFGCRFLDCNGLLCIESTVTIESTLFDVYGDALKLQQCNATISRCEFQGGTSDPRDETGEISRYGAGIQLGIHVHATFQCSIRITDCEMSSYRSGIAINTESLGEMPDTKISGNRISDCTIGLEIREEGAEIEQNLISKSHKTAISTHEGIIGEALLDDNLFEDNQALLMEYYSLEIPLYDQYNYYDNEVQIRDGAGSPVEVDLQRVWNFDKDPIYNTGDNRFRYTLELLDRTILSNKTESSLYPYQMYIYSPGDGIASVTLNERQDSINVTYREYYDLTFDDDIMWPPPVWLKHDDGADPVIRFGFRARGLLVQEIQANVTLNGESIATHYYDAWGPGGLRNIDVPIDSLGDGNIRGELAVELSSRSVADDIRPENNVYSTKIRVINEDTTIRDEVLEEDIMVFNGGNVILDNVDIEQNGYKSDWLVTSGTNLTVTHCSSDSIWDSFSIFSQKATVTIRDSTMWFLWDATFTNTSVIMKNVIWWDGYTMTFTNCTVSMNQTFIGSFYHIYIYESEFTVEDSVIQYCTFIYAIDSSIEAEQCSFLDNNLISISLCNSSFDDTLFRVSEMYFESGDTHINNSHFESCGSVSFRHDDTLLSDVSFTNCTTGLNIDSAIIEYRDLTFSNNDLDLNLTGVGPVGAFKDVEGLTRVINSVVVFEFLTWDKAPITYEDSYSGDVPIFDSATGKEMMEFDFISSTGMTPYKSDERWHRNRLFDYLNQNPDVHDVNELFNDYSMGIPYYYESVDGTRTYSGNVTIVLDLNHDYGWQKLTIEPQPPGKEIHRRIQLSAGDS